MRLKLPNNINFFRSVCLMLVGFFMLQLVSPGLAFCLKEGNRVIQCKSLVFSATPQIVEDGAGTDCCSKACREKAPTESESNAFFSEHEKGNCCISLAGEHDGAVSISYSNFHILNFITFLDPKKPFIRSNGYYLNHATDKPTSLVPLMSVVLIL